VRVLYFFFAVLVSDLHSVSPSAAEESSSQIPILLYHRFGSVASDLTTIRTSTFAEQLSWLQNHHIRVLPLSEVVDDLKGRSLPAELHAVALAADDGHRPVYTDMYPLVRQYHVHVTLFIYPSAISNASYALTWAQLGEMLNSGLIDVQSHTFWHPNFIIEKRRLRPDDYLSFVRSQLVTSKSRLDARLGIKVDLLAWPFGIHDSDLEREARKAGYTAAFGLERRPVRVGDDLYSLPRYLITDADRGARFAALIGDAGRRSNPR
jgi:peptidoglycan/xylan/chitin deacetylase (PgdA/CDA1 family)